ncbi:hypothetical protein [Cerasicoccus arenae]|uniref:hypothetical protein n=1 Tax=Cerasicoccus arenae TaxID=424488 RepID=UPI001679F654|nr:hypothetical protein [Cerasicoccus arenae]MBK1858213.1 hypothetical protein [Cerasicoccus arenae]
MLTALLSAMQRMGARRLRGTFDAATGAFDVEAVPAGPPELGCSAAELAALLGHGVSPFLVNDWAKKRKLSSVKEGKTRFFLLPVVAHDLAYQLDLADVTAGRPEVERLLIDWVLRRAPITPSWEAA